MENLAGYCNILTTLRGIIYLVLTCLCLYFSTYTLAKYMDGETITISTWAEQDSVLFPSITFCRVFAFDEVSYDGEEKQTLARSKNYELDNCLLVLRCTVLVLKSMARGPILRTTIPRTTIPRTTNPRTTIPRTTIPRTTIPKTTNPRTTTVECSVRKIMNFKLLL